MNDDEEFKKNNNGKTREEIYELLVEMAPKSAPHMRDACIQLLEQMKSGYRTDTPEGTQAIWATERCMHIIKQSSAAQETLSPAQMRDTIIQLLEQLKSNYREDTPEGNQVIYATDRAIWTIKLGYSYLK